MINHAHLLVVHAVWFRDGLIRKIHIHIDA